MSDERYKWPTSGGDYNSQLNQIGTPVNPLEDYMAQRAAEERRKMAERALGAVMTGGTAIAMPTSAPVTVPMTIAQAIAALAKQRSSHGYDSAAVMWNDAPFPNVDIAREAGARYGTGRKGPQ
jgi:hypothetical protein